MVTVARPALLASSEGLADSGTANFEPPADTSWEVHSIIVSDGPVDVKRNHDPDENDTWTGAITIRTLHAAGEAHALKLELEDGTSRLEVTNNSGGAINVYIFGVEITA